ncbi:hypothetical protein NG726_39320, partial [Pseudomonas sp. MOB-449]|nr:hypothetical protein [Pseudomonas sp. MOB-449]
QKNGRNPPESQLAAQPPAIRYRHIVHRNLCHPLLRFRPYGSSNAKPQGNNKETRITIKFAFPLHLSRQKPYWQDKALMPKTFR